MLKFDEMYAQLTPQGTGQSQSQGGQSQSQGSGQGVRPHYEAYAKWLAGQPDTVMRSRRDEAEMIFRRVGITFAVYGAKDEDGSGTERLIPFDLIPRIIPAHEWRSMEKGLVQRVTALNRFIHDVYHDQEILKAGVVPREQIEGNAQFRPEMMGVDVPNGIYSHISGIDIVRAPDAQGKGEYYVLEDNLRVPSGVSYMLENRKMMMRLFPELFSQNRVAPVAHYPDLLLDTLRASAPSTTAEPTVVVLTPGMYNSAYFRARLPGAADGGGTGRGPGPVRQGQFRLHAHHPWPQARGRDLPPRGRRLPRSPGVPPDLHPGLCRPDGGLPRRPCGDLQRCGHRGGRRQVDLPYVPKMIEFYLGEKPILNNVPTYMCRNPDDLKYVMANLKDLVVKEVHGAGGYGMLVGPAATKAEIEDFGKAVLANPAGYIAQPTLSLSSCPTYVESGVAPRHIDLRPFVLSGRHVQMVPGGLTRVALKEGSLVVNSSQGGGTKDTWILEV
jgi:uncharacterized circularly permuted ATP-grasp superfamily protein